MPITMELEAIDVRLRIEPESGVRKLVLHDPASQISVLLAMDEASAKKLAAGLNGSSLVVAQPDALHGGPVI